MELHQPSKINEAFLSGAFMGNFTHALDGKRRVTVPSDWRAAALEPLLYVLPGIGEKCLYAFASRDMLEKLVKVRAVSVGDQNAQRFLRAVFSRACKVGIDAQGRIRVSDELLAHAGISSHATLVGVGGRFELWSPETWQEQSSQWDQNTFTQAASFIGL